jgi:hypothetical protein
MLQWFHEKTLHKAKMMLANSNTLITSQMLQNELYKIALLSVRVGTQFGNKKKLINLLQRHRSSTHTCIIHFHSFPFSLTKSQIVTSTHIKIFVLSFVQI